MTVKDRRLEKGWSQKTLARISGLSVRTIQRIERGQKAGLESLNCLAAVFETTISDLQKDNAMTTATENPAAPLAEHSEQQEYVSNVRAFHLNWICFLFITPGLYWLNQTISSHFPWSLLVIGFWGATVPLYYLVIRILFGRFDLRGHQRP